MIIDEGKRREGKKKKREEGKERDRWTLRVMTHFLKLIFIGVELHYIVLVFTV